MSQEKVEIVRAALLSSVADERTALWDPQIEWLVAREHPDARSIKGQEAVAEYLSDWQTNLTGLRFEIDRILDAEHAIVAVGMVRGTGSASTVELGVPLALVCSVHAGRITRVEEYLNPAEALKAVGLEE